MLAFPISRVFSVQQQKQKLHEACKSWSNFNLVRFGGGQKIHAYMFITTWQIRVIIWHIHLTTWPNFSLLWFGKGHEMKYMLQLWQIYLANLTNTHNNFNKSCANFGLVLFGTKFVPKTWGSDGQGKTMIEHGPVLKWIFQFVTRPCWNQW